MAVMFDPARLVFPGFTVGVSDPRQAEDLVRAGVGGFCLYRGTPRAIAALTTRLQRVAGRRLLFCADYEEGAWAHATGATALPTNLGVGASGRAADAREKGLLTALEARAMGVDWVFAPVVDLAGEPRNPIVNLRAFSDRPGPATRLAAAFLEGLKAGGALGCLKHFPGHGDTTKDSHLDLPVVKAPRALLARRELSPFKALARRAGAVMTAHLLVPALEPAGLPMTLSGKGPRLLASWGFRGLVTTDALDMKAVADRWPERDAALLALRGGAHVLLVPKDARSLVAELRVECGRDPSLAPLVREAHRRLDAALARTAGRRPPLSVVGSKAHRGRAAALFSRAIAWKRPRRAPRPAAVSVHEVLPGPSQTGVFRRELSRLGVRVRVARDGRAKKGETLVAAIVSVPRAYSGRINMTPEAKNSLKKKLKAAPDAVVLSLGSPFVLAGLPSSAAALCSFSRADAAQKAAAAVLAGRAAATGRWPIES
ncbi:MAG: glycoside hydrolase family 3 N-terminal domain-containing protein [Elusimicrobiota bacterium]|nr:glycoside hydrolase family 3 N-terminal domain-containing protein [Elusimicrobiota bacterium]